MDGVRKFFYGPTPEEQKRKCNQIIRKNTRSLDREIQSSRNAEAKARSYIMQASKRAQRNPSLQKQAAQDTRVFAKELIRTRKQTQRLVTSQATLQSVSMQIDQAFAMRKIEGSIKASTGVMKDVNTLIKLPELTGTMMELSQELVKAGIIEEMVADSMPDSELFEGEDEEAEGEVDKVLGEILKDKVQTPGTQLPSGPVGPVQGKSTAEEEDEELDSEEMLAQMRGRLEALKS